MKLKSVGIIPARFHSTRFPGKPLALILGTSLLQRTYEKAKAASLLDEVIVATDDPRIFNHVIGFGGKAVMTSENCLNGTERVAEAAKHLSGYDIIVNIQGDEPCLDPQAIDNTILALSQNPDVSAATVAGPLDPEDFSNPAAVKCVFDLSGKALYFSRSLIPGSKGAFAGPYFKHIGLYAFRAPFLQLYVNLPDTPLMAAEDLEQLKILEHGFSLHITPVEKASPGVDLPEDIKKVEKFICQ
jgi:3-deoxy-manno-octulosonate cytidylyltransferase (CMP-KDO synthetase)